MSGVSVGQLIKISDSVIPASAKDDELLGALGIPGLMRHAIFEVISLQKDPNRGDVALCRITNPEVFKQVIPGVKEVKYEGELILLVSEVVPANSKISLNYVIENAKTRDQVVTELFAAREVLKSRGLDKRNKEMRENWKQIQILRGELAGPMPTLGKVSVFLPKQKLRFELQPGEALPGTDEESIKRFQRFLVSKLRGVRNNRNRATMEQSKAAMAMGMPTIKKQGGVFLEEGSLLKAYEVMMQTTLETDKKPIDPKANYVGIEVEFSYTGKYEILKRLLIENKLHKYVCLKEDGSLRACHNTSYRTKELTLICKNTEVEGVMQRLDKVLANPEIDAYANRSCGLHVHLDMRNRNADLAYKNLVRIQNILRGAQPVGRVNNTHCRPNSSDKLGDSARDDGGNGRYVVVNGQAMAKHKSIEIRIHEGTTDCEAIYNWVSFLDAVASHKGEIPKNEIKFAEDLVAKFDIDIPLHAIDYVDRRIERFNSLSVATA
jgi:hypothetical protein